MSIESKIAEIVCPKCKYMEKNGECSSCPGICTIIFSLQALFTEQQAGLVKALRRAARQAYQNEIIDAEMQHISIGRGKEWETKEDWIKDRITEWMVK